MPRALCLALQAAAPLHASPSALGRRRLYKQLGLPLTPPRSPHVLGFSTPVILSSPFSTSIPTPIPDSPGQPLAPLYSCHRNPPNRLTSINVTRPVHHRALPQGPLSLPPPPEPRSTLILVGGWSRMRPSFNAQLILRSNPTTPPASPKLLPFNPPPKYPWPFNRSPSTLVRVAHCTRLSHSCPLHGLSPYNP